jgi:ankyrin repeat protein
MQAEIQNILEKNSQRILAKISASEIIEIQNAIAAFIDEIEASPSSEEKAQLINFHFGAAKNTILHLAAKFSDDFGVRKILEIAQDQSYVDVKNDDLFTALHFAAINGSVEIVETLILAGADKNPKASEQKRGWFPIQYAAKHGSLGVVDALIRFGVDKEVKTAFGLTPLLVAVEFGHIEIVKFLLSINVKLNVQTSEDNQKMTALHYAVIGNYRDIAEVLLAAGIDKEKETTFGLTAFEFAAKNNLSEMVSLLLEWGVCKIESALKIALSNDSNEAANQIKNYQKACSEFFSTKFLNASSSSLIKAIKEYDENNLSEAKIILSPEVAINAYGILSLKQQFGFFKKVTKTLPQFLSENGPKELSVALKDLEALTKKTKLDSYS